MHKFSCQFNGHITCQTGTILRVKGDDIGNYARMIGITKDSSGQSGLSSHLSYGSMHIQ